MRPQVRTGLLSQPKREQGPHQKDCRGAEKQVFVCSTSVLPGIICTPFRKVLLEPFLWGRSAGSVERCG